MADDRFGELGKGRTRRSRPVPRARERRPAEREPFFRERLGADPVYLLEVGVVVAALATAAGHWFGQEVAGSPWAQVVGTLEVAANALAVQGAGVGALNQKS